MNEEILSKAKQIISEKNKEKDYRETCLKVRICPDCGEKLDYMGHGGEFDFAVYYVCPKCPPIVVEKKFLWHKYKKEIKKIFAIHS